MKLNCKVCNKEYSRPHPSSRAKTCGDECSIELRRSRDRIRSKSLEYLEERRNNDKIKAYRKEYAKRPEVLKRMAEKAALSRASGKFTGWVMKAWSDAVKQSWNYACGSCGSSEQLEAHHIIPRSIMPEYSAIISNGICLCKKCHYNLHLELRRLS